MTRDFIWFDDNFFVSEHYVLDAKGLCPNVYVFNPKECDAAKQALEFMKNCPMGEVRALRRFTSAVVKDFELAKTELAASRKDEHYMWYMFPQIRGLGFSDRSKYYAIKDETEAVEFLNDGYLSGKLVELCETLLRQPESDPLMILSDIDAIKLRSCMTLFARTYENNGADIKNTAEDFTVFRKIYEG